MDDKQQSHDTKKHKRFVLMRCYKNTGGWRFEHRNRGWTANLKEAKKYPNRSFQVSMQEGYLYKIVPITVEKRTITFYELGA